MFDTGTKRLDMDSPSLDSKPTCKLENDEKHITTPDGEKRRRKDRKKKKFADDEPLKCETCGCYGIISEFRSSGLSSS